MNPFVLYKEILEKYLLPATIRELEAAWHEPRRKYHNIDHLQQILRDLEKKKRFVLPIHWEALVIAAFFHDAVYIPGHQDNEDKSLQWIIHVFQGKDMFMLKKIGEMIECTKFRKKPQDPLLRIFWDADNAGFVGSFENFLGIEKKIREEFKHVSQQTYKKGRISFLKSCLGIMGPKADSNIKKLLEYIEINY